MTTTTDNAQASGLVSAEMLRSYQEEGFFILPGVVSGDELELLRSGAQASIDEVDARMDAEGVDVVGINVRGRRYFGTWRYREMPQLRSFVFGDTMAQICRAVLGEEAYLFWEQYVIKGADPESSFAWHQDSGYVHEDAPAYLTVWIALDDVTEQNGSVYLLPFSRSGIRSYVKHIVAEGTNDKVCYFGSDPGDPVVVPAGSLVCFSSMLFHRSGPNLTDQLRRVYLLQYSDRVITEQDGETPAGSFEQFLHLGDVVAER